MASHSNNDKPGNGLLRWLAFALSGALAICSGFEFTNPLQAENGFLLLGYANMAVLFACLAFVAWKLTSANKIRELVAGKSGVALLACVAAAAFLYTREGGGFKISFDEQLLTNVSKNLHEQHLPYARISTMRDVPTVEMIDKRPLAFPFLLSLLHGLTGYRAENAFFLNFGLTAALLYTLFTLARRAFDPKAGYFVLLLACASPLIEQNSSGGGFEVLNVLSLFIIVRLSVRYLQMGGGLNLTALLFATVFASHVRYESALLVIPVGLIVAIKWIREGKIELLWLNSLVPLLFVPLVWQHRAIASNPGRFQYKTDGDGNFSFGYFSDNLSKAFDYFFLPNSFYPSSPFVSFIGIASLLGLFAFGATRGRALLKDRPERSVLLGYGVFITGLLAMVLCFFMGDLTQPVTSRLALPFVVLLTLAGGIGLSLIYNWASVGKLAACALSGLSLLYATKVYSFPEYTYENKINSKIAWVKDFAESLPSGNYLLVTTLPHAMEIYGYNCIDIVRARQLLGNLKLHLDLKTYNEILLVQNLSFDLEGDRLVASPLPNNTLGPAVELETLAERSLIPYNLTRISRISEIDLEKDVPFEALEDYQELENYQFKYVSRSQFEDWKKSLP